MALHRLVQAYNQAAATLNLLRGFSTGGYAGLQRVTQWNLDFMDKSDEGQVRSRVHDGSNRLLLASAALETTCLRRSKITAQNNR